MSAASAAAVAPHVELLAVAGRPALLWRAGPGWRMAASTVLGGGIGEREWVLNVEVPKHYARVDPDVHLLELAGECGVTGPGVGMLTAAWVREYAAAEDGGVGAVATIGLTAPTWAAADEEAPAEARPGTINLVVAVPAALSDAALVNAVATATEAKAQALLESGFCGTGTASDAVCVAALRSGPAAAFAGPRSLWGARLARAVHRAVVAGAERWRRNHPALAAALDARSADAGDAPAELRGGQRDGAGRDGRDDRHVGE